MPVASSNLAPANSPKATLPRSWVARAKEYFLSAVRKVYAQNAGDLAFLSLGISGICNVDRRSCSAKAAYLHCSGDLYPDQRCSLHHSDAKVYFSEYQHPGRFSFF